MTAALIVLIILGNTAWLVANVRMSRKINALASVMVAQIGGGETYREAAPRQREIASPAAPVAEAKPRVYEPIRVDFNLYKCPCCGWSERVFLTGNWRDAVVVKGKACSGCDRARVMHVHASCDKCGGRWLAMPQTKQMAAG